MISYEAKTVIPARVINLNNKAVSFIHEGNHEKAVKVLGHALTMSKQILTDTGAPGSSCSQPKPRFSLDQCMIQSPSMNAPAGHVNGNALYTYQKAILLPQDMPTDFDSSIIISIVIIFNLALSHHLTAFSRNGAEKRGCLKKAAKLYELALSLHSQEKHIESAIFIMACVNNLGSIYREFSDMSTSERCFQHLLQTLMFLVDCRQEKMDISLLDGFFKNATRQMFKRTAAAAA